MRHQKSLFYPTTFLIVVRRDTVRAWVNRPLFRRPNPGHPPPPQLTYLAVDMSADIPCAVIANFVCLISMYKLFPGWKIKLYVGVCIVFLLARLCFCSFPYITYAVKATCVMKRCWHTHSFPAPRVIRTLGCLSHG
jgi:hypothetical protein